MAASNPESEPSRFTWGLLIVFCLVGLAAIYAIWKSLSSYKPLDDSAARSIITVVFSIGTMAIAIIVVLASVLLEKVDQLENRIGRAKEVLTILVGILGTIIGFYFGQATATKQNVPPGTKPPPSSAPASSPAAPSPTTPS